MLLFTDYISKGNILTLYVNKINYTIVKKCRQLCCFTTLPYLGNSSDVTYCFFFEWLGFRVVMKARLKPQPEVVGQNINGLKICRGSRGINSVALIKIILQLSFLSFEGY